MKEQQPKTINSCYPLSHSLGENGQITSAEIRVTRGRNSYVLNIATREYVSGLKEYNSNLPEELQLDDNIYKLLEMPHEDQLCHVIGQIPFEDLEPFLVEILEDDR